MLSGRDVKRGRVPAAAAENGERDRHGCGGCRSEARHHYAPLTWHPVPHFILWAKAALIMGAGHRVRRSFGHILLILFGANLPNRYGSREPRSIVTADAYPSLSSGFTTCTRTQFTG